ncbi:MAG: hypothetical protein K6T78_02195 [Alicyclobacillus sp.]|nr:hypothetical protein [Alicyclobacillus sp.]
MPSDVEVQRSGVGAAGAVLARQPSRTVGWLVALNALVAVTGYGKDLAVAAVLGTGLFGDAYAGAYFLADAAGAGILGNALSVVASAQFSAVRARAGALGFSRLFRRTGWTVVGIGAVLALVLVALRQPLVRFSVQAPGEWVPTASLLSWLAPIALLYPVYYLLAGALQSLGRFTLCTASPLVMNLGILACAWAAWHGRLSAHATARVLSAAVSGAVLLMTLLLAWDGVHTRRQAFARSAQLRAESTDSDFTAHPPYATFVKMALVYACYLSLAQMVGLVERRAASGLAVGELAALTYALRIEMVPSWVFVSSLTTFTVPAFAAAFARSDHGTAARLLSIACKWCIEVCLPVSIALYVLRLPFVALLLGRGAFTVQSIHWTSAYLGGYSVAIVMQALGVLLFRLCAAAGKLGVPLAAAAAGSAVNIVFDWLVTPHLGPVTLGLGAFLNGAVSVPILWRFARQRLTQPTVLRLRRLWRTAIGNAAVAVLATAAGLLAHRLGSDDVNGRSSAVLLCGAAVVMAATYASILSPGSLGRLVRLAGRAARRPPGLS